MDKMDKMDKMNSSKNSSSVASKQIQKKRITKKHPHQRSCRSSSVIVLKKLTLSISQETIFMF